MTKRAICYTQHRTKRNPDFIFYTGVIFDRWITPVNWARAAICNEILCSVVLLFKFYICYSLCFTLHVSCVGPFHYAHSQSRFLKGHRCKPKVVVLFVNVVSLYKANIRTCILDNLIVNFSSVKYTCRHAKKSYDIDFFTNTLNNNLTS